MIWIRYAACLFAWVLVLPASATTSAAVTDCVECGFGADNGEKPQALTLRYSGAAGVVTVYRKDKVEADNLLFEGFLSPGEVFTLRASDIGERDLGSKVGIYVNGAKVAEIHTSCSAPLGPGTTEQTQGDKGKDPNGIIDVTVVSGIDKQGRELCPIPPPPPPPPPGSDCVECGFGADDGQKPRELTLRYSGAAGIVAVYRKDKVEADNLLFEGFLSPGDVFTLRASDIGERDLGSKVGIYVDGAKVAELHTSCSAPLGPGTTEQTQGDKGKDPNGIVDVTVMGGIDKDGQTYCGSETCPDAGPPTIQFEWVYDLDPDDPTVGHGVYVTVADDTEIGEVSFIYDTSNIELISSDIGSTESVYTFRVLSLIANSFIQVSATDACGTATCPGDPNPPTLTLGAPSGGVVNGMFADDTGIVDIDFFFLVNATATSTFDPGLSPQPTVDFQIQRVSSYHEAQFGILAADYCNAFIFDPVIPAEGKWMAGPRPGVIAAASGPPAEYVLRANRPNPFRESTEIEFELPESSPVRLAVFDVLGREVTVLADGMLDAGTHRFTLDGQDLPAGTYVYRLLTPQRNLTGTMMRTR